MMFDIKPPVSVAGSVVRNFLWSTSRSTHSLRVEISPDEVAAAHSLNNAPASLKLHAKNNHSWWLFLVSAKSMFFISFYTPLSVTPLNVEGTLVS